MTNEDFLLSPTVTRLISVFGSRVQVHDLYSTVKGAILYDAFVAGDQSELEIILLALRDSAGDVLDLGCGSGRLTIPLLSRGRKVVGLDSAMEMLERLKTVASTLPVRFRERLEISHQDMSSFEFEGRDFGVIVLGATTVTLLSPHDRMSTFKAVSRSLTVDGVFIVSTLDIDGNGESFEDGISETTRVIALPVDGVERVVALVETVDHGSSFREVALIDFGQPGQSLGLNVFVSRPALVFAETLAHELELSGLRTLSREMIPATPGRSVTVFTCGKVT